MAEEVRGGGGDAARSAGVAPHERRADYLLKVVTTDIDGCDAFYKKLIRSAPLTGVSSAFSMEQIKSTTALPLGAAAIVRKADKQARIKYLQLAYSMHDDPDLA